MNTTKKSLIAIICGVSLMLIGGVSFADDWVMAPVGASYVPAGFNTFEGSWLVGYQVQSREGSSLGTASGYVIDQANDRIALVLLSDVPDAGERYVAVPYSALDRLGENTFRLSFGGNGPGVGGTIPFGLIDPAVYLMEHLPSNLVGIPSVIDPSWVAAVYDFYGQAPYWTEPGMKPIASNALYQSGQLIGKEIRDAQGGIAGQADDLVIDASDGHIAFVSLIDVPGREGSPVAVPFACLSETGGSFVLDISQAQLASAPSFHATTELTDRDWAGSVYKYFGLQPYWTE